MPRGSEFRSSARASHERRGWLALNSVVSSWRRMPFRGRTRVPRTAAFYGTSSMTLQFELNHAHPTTVATDCIVLGVFADGALSASGMAIDGMSNGRLRTLIARGDV